MLKKTRFYQNFTHKQEYCMFKCTKANQSTLRKQARFLKHKLRTIGSPSLWKPKYRLKQKDVLVHEHGLSFNNMRVI